MIYTYQVEIYGVEGLNGSRTIHATSAAEAVACVRQFMGYVGGFSFTSEYQSSEDEGSRDNAHIQFNKDGTSGCVAIRLESHPRKSNELRLPIEFRKAANA